MRHYSGFLVACNSIESADYKNSQVRARDALYVSPNQVRLLIGSSTLTRGVRGGRSVLFLKSVLVILRLPNQVRLLTVHVVPGEATS